MHFDVSNRVWRHPGDTLCFGHNLGLPITFRSHVSDLHPAIVIQGRAFDDRMDVIIERPETPDGTNSFAHEARVFRNRQDDPTVIRFATAFEEAWKNGTLLDETLTQALLDTLDGTEAR